jgi:hypothetical protein
MRRKRTGLDFRWWDKRVAVRLLAFSILDPRSLGGLVPRRALVRRQLQQTQCSPVKRTSIRALECPLIDDEHRLGKMWMAIPSTWRGPSTFTYFEGQTGRQRQHGKARDLGPSKSSVAHRSGTMRHACLARSASMQCRNWRELNGVTIECQQHEGPACCIAISKHCNSSDTVIHPFKNGRPALIGRSLISSLATPGIWAQDSRDACACYRWHYYGRSTRSSPSIQGSRRSAQRRRDIGSER